MVCLASSKGASIQMSMIWAPETTWFLATSAAVLKSPFLVYSRSKGNSFTNSGEENLGEKKIYKGKTLVMKPAYGSDSFWKNMETLNDRISQYKPWFLKHFYLDAIVILFLATSVAIVIILILV